MKKEADVLSAIDEEDKFWKSLANAAMAKAWGKEDSVWERKPAHKIPHTRRQDNADRKKPDNQGICKA